MKVLSNRLDASGCPVWVPIGPSLTVSTNSGQIDAKRRRYDVPLPYHPSLLGWVLPTGASEVVIHVNGLRYGPSNYTITGDLLKANYDNMPPDSEVAADYFG